MSTPADLQIGSVLDGRYRILSPVGAGGMGCVYRAEHTGTGRRVAVKLILAPEANENPASVDRFHREARAAGAIDTQHIAQVLDVGKDSATKTPYIVMELLSGEDLKHLHERLGPVSPDLALRIAAQACIGLQRAHEAGVIHRDIKPANLFLAERDAGERVLKVLDFGIAKVKAGFNDEVSPANLTRTEGFLGSPSFMSPEQIRKPKSVDERSDLWSLGVVLYQLLTGKTPHEGVTGIGELILAICSDAPRPVRDLAPWVPARVSAIVERALRLDRSERFPTAHAMFESLRAELPNGWAITGDLLVSAPEHTPATSLSAPPKERLREATGSAMGRVERKDTGEVMVLRSSTVVGRSSACELCVADPCVSTTHARLRWTGTTWEVRDLASKNGTFVGGRRLSGGEKMALLPGDTLGFGGAELPAPMFVLIDASAPVPSARSSRTGTLRFAEGGLLTLPDDDHPEVSVVEGREGKWTVEIGDTVREATDGETLVLGEDEWLLDISAVAASTLAAEAPVRMLETIGLRFSLSPEGGDVTLTVVCPDREIELPPERHHPLLLALARERLRADAAPPSERGWVDRTTLSETLGETEQRVLVDVCSARRQLASLGIQGAAGVIERRPGSLALRLGVECVEVQGEDG
ncbi:MAG: FHA domain-containing serine/threonine-protein kinase [Polyangiaceae bacterium]